MFNTPVSVAQAELAKTMYYSTNFYTERALALLRNFSDVAADSLQLAKEGGSDPAAAVATAARIWIHLCYQAVHGPFTDVPEWVRNVTAI